MKSKELKDAITRCEVLETQEGKTRDFCDILIAGGKDGADIWLKGVPFFDEGGHEVGYDKALELYGEDGLSDGIWDTESYRAYITAYAYKSCWRELLEEHGWDDNWNNQADEETNAAILKEVTL